jgi:hypothetical protein
MIRLKGSVEASLAPAMSTFESLTSNRMAVGIQIQFSIAFLSWRTEAADVPRGTWLTGPDREERRDWGSKM